MFFSTKDKTAVPALTREQIQQKHRDDEIRYIQHLTRKAIEDAQLKKRRFFTFELGFMSTHLSTMEKIEAALIVLDPSSVVKSVTVITEPHSSHDHTLKTSVGLFVTCDVNRLSRVA